MKPIIIDKEKCIGCGKCVKDCVSEKLGLIDGKAVFKYERCIQCGHCFAICPIPVSGAGRVCAAMWNANGEAQTIRVRYELKSSNTKLDISLQGGFTPPTNHTAYVFCYKLIS